MASIVEICNTALAHLGDDATVASIDPPEGSPQAEHCKRFYPMAVRNTLERHAWAFATKRAILAELTLPTNINQWQYVYALPADFITAIAVLDYTAPDDFNSLPNPPFMNYLSVPIPPYTPQPYNIESFANGTKVLYTNQQYALLRYVSDVNDTSKFSGLFTDAATRLLASYLAGPVIKGTEGRQVAQTLLKEYEAVLALAKDQDGEQTDIDIRHTPDWIGSRN